MEKDPTYPIDLITTYLAGEAGADDLVFLESWLKADPGNRKIFEEHRKIWLGMEKTRLDAAVDTDKEWIELQAQVSRKQEAHRIITLSYRQIIRIAAIVLLLAVPSFFILRYFSHPELKQFQATLTIQEGTLPDGTSVTLNKGASLQYPASFRGNKRNVNLSGEAWFEVKHDDNKPFIITSKNVMVEVLGTSFYINTNAASNTMEVILNSGSVAVYFDGKPENRLLLSPGEKAEILPGEEKMAKDINTDQNYNAWMTQRFIYNNTPLITIVGDLNKVYHANLRIVTPSANYCLVTATFDHQSLESILHVLQATLDLNITVNGSMTDISGKKCN